MLVIESAVLFLVLYITLDVTENKVIENLILKMIDMIHQSLLNFLSMITKSSIFKEEKHLVFNKHFYIILGEYKYAFFVGAAGRYKQNSLATERREKPERNASNREKQRKPAGCSS